MDPASWGIHYIKSYRDVYLLYHTILSELHSRLHACHPSLNRLPYHGDVEIDSSYYCGRISVVLCDRCYECEGG